MSLEQVPGLITKLRALPQQYNITVSPSFLLMTCKDALSRIIELEEESAALRKRIADATSPEGIIRMCNIYDNWRRDSDMDSVYDISRKAMKSAITSALAGEP